MDAKAMQPEARQMVRLLAQGINPVTGEMLPDESPYNTPSVIRALFSVLDITDDVRTDKPPRDRPEMHGKPWTAEDRERLAAAYLTGESENSLAEVFRRTRGGIRAELIRQGLIEDTGAPPSH